MLALQQPKLGQNDMNEIEQTQIEDREFLGLSVSRYLSGK